MKRLACPACKVAMKKIGDKELELVIDNCPKCQGLWFDAGEIKQFLASDKMKGRFLLDHRSGDDAHSYSLSGGERPCPRCRKSMDQPVVGGITVDVCRECAGIWLDFGELNRLVKDYKRIGLKGDEAVIEEIRQGLKGGKIQDGGLLARILQLLKELAEKIF